jgi:uncharacterized protein (TIRG00374 family)
VKRRLLALGGFALAALFVWLTFRRADWGAIRGELGKLPFSAFAAALALKAAAFAFMALRSRVLLAPLHPPGFAALYSSLLLAFVGNNLLPLRAGELMRIGYLVRRSALPAAACLSAIALERALDILCLVALCALALPQVLAAVPAGATLAGLGALAFAAAALALLASRHPERLMSWAAGLARPLPQRLARPLLARSSEVLRGLAALSSARAVLASLVWTLAYWSCMAAGISVWLGALELDVPTAAPLVVLMFISLQALLPVPGQVGSYHYFAAAAVATQGVDATRAATFALVLHFMSFVPFTLIGIGALLGEWTNAGLRRRISHSASAEARSR